MTLPSSHSSLPSPSSLLRKRHKTLSHGNDTSGADVIGPHQVKRPDWVVLFPLKSPMAPWHAPVAAPLQASPASAPHSPCPEPQELPLAGGRAALAVLSPASRLMFRLFCLPGHPLTHSPLLQFKTHIKYYLPREDFPALYTACKTESGPPPLPNPLAHLNHPGEKVSASVPVPSPPQESCLPPLAPSAGHCTRCPVGVQ